MRITLLSDLHHEINYGFPPNFNMGSGDVLLLAGDVTCARYFWPRRTDAEARTVQGLFERLIENGLKGHDRILIIPGNHDYWGGGIHWGEVVPMMQDVCLALDPRVSYTACGAFEHKGVHFLCTTLWTDFYGANASAMLAAGSWMNDYNYTTLAPSMYLTPEFILEEHVRQKAFLNESLAILKDQKVVVMTHHAPSVQSIEPFRKDHPATCAYYTALPLGATATLTTMWITRLRIHGSCHGSVVMLATATNPTETTKLSSPYHSRFDYDAVGRAEASLSGTGHHNGARSRANASGGRLHGRRLRLPWTFGTNGKG
jgi:hypothetical protein